MLQTVLIERLGAQGDGVAEAPSGRLHIPFVAPGDEVEIESNGRGKARLVRVLTSGPARATPSCRHFGRCGGCAIQHIDPAHIAPWKRQRVIDALALAGVRDVPVADTIAIAPGTRRRATLAAKKLKASMLLGFAERASHRLIDLVECPVLLPELVALLGPMRSVLDDLLDNGEEADIGLTRAENGIDLLLTRRRSPSLPERETLASFAEAHDLARIAWRAGETRTAEPIAERRAPIMRFGAYAVAPPPGAFLQPSAEGEAALAALIEAELASANVDGIVDLFCGLGTFSLPAMAHGRVGAFDGDAASISALQGAIRGQNLVNRVTAARRDLFRDPLTADELERFQAAIFDPPRAGAEAQAKMLAGSAIPTVIAISCNPTTFARDAALLVAGGYRLERTVPIDQFPWSAHVELAAIFRR